MATDKRISALPSITTPQSSDVLPIVSSGVTSQITVGNLLTNSIFIPSGSGYQTSNSITLGGNLLITGTTTLEGNIIPLTPRGATLGTLEKPFGDIYVSSGSINIAGIVGQPNTTLSNVSGNILISAGGMQLIGSGAFNAATGSFQFISGSMEQIGNYTQTGNYSMVGNKNITGSLNISGSGNINQHRILTDLDSGSYAKTTSNQFNGNQTITGSLLVSGSLIISGSQTVYGDITRVGTNVITGSLIVTGSLLMGGTEQIGLLAKSITNPNNYIIHQFLTASYHGATYAFSAVEDSTGKSTVYSNYIVAVGAGSIASKIGGDSQLSSGAGAPNPSFTIAVSGSYAQFKVTDTGTFTYRGIVQLY
jgi:hypothetical protein